MSAARKVLWVGLFCLGIVGWLAGYALANAALPNSGRNMPEAGGWVVSCIDCPKNFQFITNRNLALDSLARPRVVYGYDHLYYAWHDGVTWHYETVDSSPNVGAYAALALDSEDYRHIA